MCRSVRIEPINFLPKEQLFGFEIRGLLQDNYNKIKFKFEQTDMIVQCTFIDYIGYMFWTSSKGFKSDESQI